MEQSRILLVFTNSHIALFWIPKIGLISLFLLSDNSRTVGYVFGKSRGLCMVCLFWKYCAELEWKKSVLEIFCRIRTGKKSYHFPSTRSCTIFYIFCFTIWMSANLCLVHPKNVLYNTFLEIVRIVFTTIATNAPSVLIQLLASLWIQDR